MTHPSTFEQECRELRARVAELELALERTADACLILMAATKYEGDRDAVLRHADAAFGGRFEQRRERE